MEIGVFEARNRFSELIEAAERGEEVVVLKRGRPVARIIPASDEVRVQRRREASNRAAELRLAVLQEAGRPFTHEELIAARDEDRR